MFRIFTEPQQGASYDQLLAVARTAEAAGYGAFFRSDHVLKMGDVSGLPGVTDAWTTLAGLARDTSTIRLGTLVTPVTFRHLGDFAVIAAQVDQMSNGRVDIGLGAGWYGVDGVRPDLMTFGKVMGGGFPAAAFGGRADVMAMLSPEGPVYQAGTLSGNPVATAAGLATLRLATEEVYARVDEVAAVISTAATEALAKAGVPHLLQSNGNMFSVFFTDAPAVPDYATASEQDLGAFKAFFHAMLDRGVYLPPSAFEAWFCSSAHDDRAVQHVLDALPDAAEAAGAVR